MSGNQIPSLPGKKRRQMPGVCRGGMLKLRFDWYITSLAKKREMHLTGKPEKLPSLLTKTEQKPKTKLQEKTRKPRKTTTAVFKCENRKTEPKIGHIPETKNP